LHFHNGSESFELFPNLFFKAIELQLSDETLAANDGLIFMDHLTIKNNIYCGLLAIIVYDVFLPEYTINSDHSHRNLDPSSKTLSLSHHPLFEKKFINRVINHLTFRSFYSYANLGFISVKIDISA
jgi:hypothetical protein